MKRPIIRASPATLPVRRDLADADVVHPRAPVDGREPVRLRDDQQVALERALAHVVGQVRERPRPRVGGRRLVGEDPQPRSGHDAVGPVGDPVLAVAEQDEVVGQQPLEEGDGLVDLVVGVAGEAGAGELDHAPAALGHRREVEHGAADVAEDRLGALGERRQLVRVQPAVEVEVHDRLARGRLARVQHAGDPAVGDPLQPEDRVQHADDADPLRLELGADAVDEERQVVGVRLEHAAGALVAVLLGRRVERADGDRAVAAGGREVERARDLGEQRLRRRGLGGVGGEPAEVLGGECAQRGRVLRTALGDQRQQPLADGCDGELPRLGRSGHPAPSCHCARSRQTGVRYP